MHWEPAIEARKLKRIAWIVAIVIVAAAAFSAYHSFEPMADWSGLVEEWVEARGVLGVAVFGAIYVVSTLLLLPAAVLNVIAGALFGLVWGVGVVMISSMTAAIAAFLIARHLVRERIRRHYTRDGMPAAIDKALCSEGWRAVALLRLSPVIPFALKSYLFGVSRVRMRDYVIGTFLGKLPGAIVLTALGTTGRAAMDLPGTPRWGLLAAGIAATLLVTWLVGRAARKGLGLT
jgi:uncharacterized membrane protein YdjX (TVP38/TMEM64 family)